MTKRKHTTQITEGEGTVSFTGPEGDIYIHATFGGSFYLHTRSHQTAMTTGVSITNTELATLAAALTRLAARTRASERST